MRTRAGRRAWAKQPSDCEGRRPGGIGLGGIGGKNVAAGRRADRMRIAAEPLRQGRQVWRDKRHGLRGEAAERTLIAATTARRVLAGGFVIVDVGAELRRIAEDRLELGGDRRVISASESRRGERRRGRGGEQLNNERERDDECGQGRAKSRRAKLRPTQPPLPFGATAAHVDLLLDPKIERQPNASLSVHRAQIVTAAAR